MQSDWRDLAQTVIGLGAPMLGQALGGPFGGVAGKILAETLGASAATPAAVSNAIAERSAEPTLTADALRQAEGNWAAAVADLGKAQIAEVNQTMRGEAASGDLLQRWWRPLYALELSLLECPAFAATVLHALWTPKEAAINGLGNLSGLLVTYFGARFGVLGVYVSGRSREKQTAITGETIPSLIGEVVKAVTKRR
jgi:hypothetical protein